MRVFTAGNTIRHKKPYWGEMAYHINDVKSIGVIGIPTGSKHGKAWEGRETACIICHESEEKYKICPLYMRAWLWILGKIVKLRKY